MIHTKLREKAEELDKHTGYITHCASCNQTKYFKNKAAVINNSKLNIKPSCTLYKIKKEKFTAFRRNYYCSQKCRTIGKL